MFKLLGCLAFACVALSFSLSRAADKDEDYCKVELRGTISAGLVAIGGETTGITISVGKTTLELEIKDPELKKLAEKLNGKKAIVHGTLEIRPGVEIHERKIVVVKELKAAD